MLKATIKRTFTTFYNREKEISFMKSLLEQKPTINIVTGSNDTGKTALINHVLSNVVDQSKLYKVKLDFRKINCLNSNDLASEIKNAMYPKYYDKIFSKIRNFNPNIEIYGFIH